MEIDLTKVTKEELLNRCNSLLEQLAKYEIAFSRIRTYLGAVDDDTPESIVKMIEYLMSKAQKLPTESEGN